MNGGLATCVSQSFKCLLRKVGIVIVSYNGVSVRAAGCEIVGKRRWIRVYGIHRVS